MQIRILIWRAGQNPNYSLYGQLSMI